ncbi:SEL1-like repeat protein [Labrys miyagiensis]
MAQMYEYGRGVERDYSQALAWYRKAAAQGHMGASVAAQRLNSPPGMLPLRSP